MDIVRFLLSTGPGSADCSHAEAAATETEVVRVKPARKSVQSTVQCCGGARIGNWKEQTQHVPWQCLGIAWALVCLLFSDIESALNVSSIVFSVQCSVLKRLTRDKID